MQRCDHARTVARERHLIGAAKAGFVFGCGISAGCLAAISDAPAQTVAQPVTRQEVAQEEIAGPQTAAPVPVYVLPPQSNMREVRWSELAGRDLSDIPAFFRDSLVQVVVRSYFLTRDNSDGSRSRAWASGGWIAYRSGLIADHFGIHGALYTSQPWFADPNEGGSKLLNPQQESLTMLGQAYAFAQFGDQEIRGGRTLIDTPLINPQDNRMVPNTFESVMATTLPSKTRDYDYSVGYIWTIKQRDSNDFISLSDAIAGADVLNRGAPYGMVKYRPSAIPGLSTIFMDYYLQDFVNTGFAQGEYTFQLPKDMPQWLIGANVIDQRSVDTAMLGTFATYQASGRVQMQYVGFTAFVAGSATGDESKIFSPFGTKPNYTDMQQVSFDNAREKAVGASLAYDLGYAFGKFGLSGLTFGAWYTHGWDAINPATNAAIQNRDELDLWAQYRPSDGPLKGLRVKLQYSDLWQQGNVRSPQPEFRAIVDYTVLFRP
jgi:outer membrane porin, OprD family